MNKNIIFFIYFQKLTKIKYPFKKWKNYIILSDQGKAFSKRRETYDFISQTIRI